MCDRTHAELDRLLSEKEEKIAKLEKRIEKLEGIIALYESPHIPSSKHIIREVRTPEEPKEPAKRGAPEGHVGATRQKPKPNRIIDLKPKSCPVCGRKNITVLDEHSKVVEDIAIVKTVTEYHYYDCRCEHCKGMFATSDPELPSEGCFGPNITSLWEMMYYYGAMPFDRLSHVSKNCFGVEITPGGLHNAVYRNSAIFQPCFDGIAKRVSRSKYARSDETSYPFNGENYWMWNISTAKDTLVLIRKNRNAKVLKEVFGEFFDGVLNSDCFRAYDRFKAREYQKCWAHVLRDAKDLAKNSEEGAELYRKLLHMYDYIRNAKEKHREDSPAVRAWMLKQKREMGSWIDRHYMSKAVKNLALRMSKYSEHWFTCLKYDFVEPTNNASERDIRKGVIARKISGQHRSVQGQHAREVMMSTLLTNQKRDINPFQFVLDGIRKHNLCQN